MQHVNDKYNLFSYFLSRKLKKPFLQNSETAMNYDEFAASEEKPEKKKKNAKRKRSPSPVPKVTIKYSFCGRQVMSSISSSLHIC